MPDPSTRAAAMSAPQTASDVAYSGKNRAQEVNQRILAALQASPQFDDRIQTALVALMENAIGNGVNPRDIIDMIGDPVLTRQGVDVPQGVLRQ